MLDTPTPAPANLADGNRQVRRDWLIVGISSVALLVVAGGVVWWDSSAFPGVGHTHSHAAINPTVGEPGNPNLPARTIEVAMIEGDGAMRFEPSAIAVAKGDQVRFKITNRGMLEHEFILSTLTDNLQHLEEMKQTPGMVHNGANAITLNPNASGEILWHFTQAGSFDFSCLIAGHREAGMHGSILVK